MTVQTQNQCAKCGSRLFDTLSTFERNKEPWRRVACHHCGHKWSLSVETEHVTKTVIDFVRNKCPFCQCAKIPIQKTRGPLRYHNCTRCGKSFQSYEK